MSRRQMFLSTAKAALASAIGGWAPPPPQPGLCWYYSDPSQRSGFWDTCP